MAKILLVDSDPSDRLVVQTSLVDEGFQVDLAESGARGLVEARNGRYDLVLIAADLHGGVTTAEVCRRLRSFPSLVGVPLLVYSNLAATSDACDRVYKSGADLFVDRSQMAVLGRLVAVQLGARRRFEELREQAGDLELENRRLREELERSLDLVASDEPSTGRRGLMVRELAAERPDGLLVVDAEAHVRLADRGACELLGGRPGERTLGQIMPNSGLEAFVRDARTAPRSGFRFDLAPRGGRSTRSLLASVVPLDSSAPRDEGGLRAVLLLDVGKRRVAEDMLRAHDPGIPRRQLGSLLEAARKTYSLEAVGCRSEQGAELCRRVERLCGSTVPVLVTGEPGAGKEFVARTLHYRGPATGAFLEVHCKALTADSLEKELFGYVKGAFPSAIADCPGLLLLAQDGTLLLNEVGALPLPIQRQLLDFLDEGGVRRLGSTRREASSARLIASTTGDLDAEARAGRFDAELLARLSARVDVPPLRERPQDLPVLATRFLERFRGCSSVRGFDERALAALQQYDWPNNVAELADCIEHACRRVEGEEIEVGDLTRPLRNLARDLPEHELVPVPRPGGDVGQDPRPSLPRSWDITDEDPISLEIYEKKVLLRALHSTKGDKLAAARLLKVGKSTLYRKLKRFDIK